MPCKNKGRAVSSSLKIKCKDCNFFGVHVLGVLTLTLAGRGSGTIPPGLRAWGGHRHGEEMGCIFLFVKKPEFKKKKNKYSQHGPSYPPKEMYNYVDY